MFPQWDPRLSGDKSLCFTRAALPQLGSLLYIMSCQGMFVSLLSNCLSSCQADCSVHTRACTRCITFRLRQERQSAERKAWQLSSVRQLLFFLACLVNILILGAQKNVRGADRICSLHGRAQWNQKKGEQNKVLLNISAEGGVPHFFFFSLTTLLCLLRKYESENVPSFFCRLCSKGGVLKKKNLCKHCNCSFYSIFFFFHFHLIRE